MKAEPCLHDQHRRWLVSSTRFIDAEIPPEFRLINREQATLQLNQRSGEFELGTEKGIAN